MFHSKTPISLDALVNYAPSALASEPHSSRSNRYGFQSTVEVIRALQSEGFEIFSASESRSNVHSGFQKHMIRFRHAAALSQQAIVGGVVPELVLINSSDGSSTYKLLGGLFRFVCSNGMVVADTLIQSIKVRHTVTMIQDVLEASISIAAQTTDVLNVMDMWKMLQLTNGEQMALAIAAHHMRFADSEGHVNTAIRPEQLLQIRREEDRGSDLWSTHNRIQENVIKGGLTARAVTPSGGRGRRIATREVREISTDVKLNQPLSFASSDDSVHKA